MNSKAEPPVEQPILLYQAAAKIYPKQARGRYARLRVLAMLLLLGFYYLAPWIEIGGSPLVWFDLPHRRFHLFTLTLTPQDLIYLTWLLLIAALTLFFFTTLGGRLWCGYACPQTVWTEAFLWMERITEGDRHARIKLDQAPWSARKLLRKGSKHLLWAGFGLYTGLTFVAYFVPARELFPAALTLQLAGWPLFWSLFYGFATWGNAGFMREQVCKYMCPYARFQSAMFDKDTLIISYDQPRGEPRKSLAKKQGVAAGSCIDCSLCVQVCPTGIDIRKGLQYDCIACAACVDACDAVMDSVQQPRGLIRYTSAHAEAGQRFRLLRPRVIGYGLIWLALCIGFVVALSLRTPLQFDVIRDRHSLYREVDEGVYENLYALKFANEDSQPHRFRLSVAATDGQRYRVEPDSLLLAAGEAGALTVSVRNLAAEDGDEENAMRGIHSLNLVLQAEDAPGLRRERVASFIAGAGHD
ncbi:MAG: cytochrome c oxidase accessory protein CcoG [Stagnimonas sp.]|nr:cytochrome c oxidase accessory protein CcoG [Stagnimonas sp.]